MPTPRKRATSPGASGTADTGEAAAPSSKRVPKSVYVDEELLERVRAAVTEVAGFHPDAGVLSLSDVVEPGLRSEVERLEKEFNRGKPFRPVAKMRTGRPAAKSSNRTPRSVYIAQDLWDRARAAVNELANFRPEAGIASLSDVVEPGLRSEVERLEKEFNRGKPFRPVAAMPTGRPRQKDS